MLISCKCDHTAIKKKGNIPAEAGSHFARNPAERGRSQKPNRR